MPTAQSYIAQHSQSYTYIGHTEPYLAIHSRVRYGYVELCSGLLLRRFVFRPEASAKRVLLETKGKFSWRERCVDARQAIEGYVDIRSCRDIGGLFPLYDVKPETTTR